MDQASRKELERGKPLLRSRQHASEKPAIHFLILLLLLHYSLHPYTTYINQAWAERAAKASTMSQDEIFLAAKGAGNRSRDPTVVETAKAKKRRAMAACRISSVIQKVPGLAEKDCIIRVNDGEDPSFILNILDQTFQQK
jgi:hypothetical protein